MDRNGKMSISDGSIREVRISEAPRGGSDG